MIFSTMKTQSLALPFNGTLKIVVVIATGRKQTLIILLYFTTFQPLVGIPLEDQSSFWDTSWYRYNGTDIKKVQND